MSLFSVFESWGWRSSWFWPHWACPAYYALNPKPSPWMPHHTHSLSSLLPISSAQCEWSSGSNAWTACRAVGRPSPACSKARLTSGRISKHLCVGWSEKELRRAKDGTCIGTLACVVCRQASSLDSSCQSSSWLQSSACSKYLEIRVYRGSWYWWRVSYISHTLSKFLPLTRLMARSEASGSLLPPAR